MLQADAAKDDMAPRLYGTGGVGSFYFAIGSVGTEGSIPNQCSPILSLIGSIGLPNSSRRGASPQASSLVR